MGERLAGKVAVVIGAARGIGAAIAGRFAAEGAEVLIGDTDEQGGRACAAALGPRVRFRPTDVAREQQVQAIAEAALETCGGLDILVQNAGIYPWTLIENISAAEWDQVLGVNLRGCFFAARAALGPMRARGGGRMIFTSSITGPRVTSPGHGHYSASKAGINGFIKAAALEFAGDQITVNGIEPGNILTESVQQQRSAGFIDAMRAMIPLGRLGTCEDVANAALFLASAESAYITGTTIVVDGGQTLPESADFRIRPPA